MFSWGTYRDSGGIIGWDKSVRIQRIPREIVLPKGVKIKQIACGESHVLALSETGLLYNWGSTEQGQSGFKIPLGHKLDSLTWRELPFREGRQFPRTKTMWAGGMHSFVQLENGHLYIYMDQLRTRYVFGLNNWGQLGIGTRSEDPQLPVRLTFFDDKEVICAALSQHATVVLTSDGRLYSAGRNSYGQLGRATEEEYATEFGEVEMCGVVAQQVVAGYHHFVVVDEKGLLYTMGFGEMQQLGNGDKYEDEPRLYHVKSMALVNRKVVMASAGSQHTMILTEKLWIVC